MCEILQFQSCQNGSESVSFGKIRAGQTEWARRWPFLTMSKSRKKRGIPGAKANQTGSSKFRAPSRRLLVGLALAAVSATAAVAIVIPKLSVRSAPHQKALPILDPTEIRAAASSPVLAAAKPNPVSSPTAQTTTSPMPVSASAVPTIGNQKPFSLDTLLSVSPDQLGTVDIATMNLACAEGLPGAEKLNVMACLQLLDRWTEAVRQSTEKNFYRFRRNPAEFDNSEAVYRMMVISTVLKRNMGVKYNPKYRDIPIGPNQRDQEFFSDSRNCFLNGVLSDEKLGTCGTLPVLEIAVGRRLGYPLKLVRAKQHFFVRWESTDSKERFNIESAGDGFGTHTDEYYRSWPEAISDEEIRLGYLQSMTPQEELAAFLGERSLVLMLNGFAFPSFDMLIKAHKITPDDVLVRQSMAYYAKTIDLYESDFTNYVNQQRLFTNGGMQSGLQAAKISADYNNSLRYIARIKHDLQNP